MPDSQSISHDHRPRSIPLAALPPNVKASPNTPQRLKKDLRILAAFVELYCKAHHENRYLVELKGFSIKDLLGRNIDLCPQCSKLLHHAFVKRSHCPRDPKPQCKYCPTHCYQKVYREKIREVMRYSGMRMLLRGRIDYLFHLFF